MEIIFSWKNTERQKVDELTYTVISVELQSSEFLFNGWRIDFFIVDFSRKVFIEYIVIVKLRKAQIIF